ncbi:MAG: MerR family transcriptional regulator [Coriobacteriales bacterium]|nr:MerR family transcriptional regulator [Coriobacteriales bacterium]
MSEFSAMTGMSPSKIRFYDKAGLFTSSQREDNGYRTFTPHDAFRANAFRVLLQYGFTVETAIEMLDSRQNSTEFEHSLHDQREQLIRDIDLLKYRLTRLESALSILNEAHQKRGDILNASNLEPTLAFDDGFVLVDADDQLYINASYGYDFSVSVENRQEIAAFYELLSVTNCARIISKADLEGDSQTINPSYIISMPIHEAWRLKGCDLNKVSRLPLGKCVRFRRELTREQSVQKETFNPLFEYLELHGYKLRSDILLLPTFMNLDGQGADIETLLVPVS